MVSSILLLFSDPDDFSRYAPMERSMASQAAVILPVAPVDPEVFP
jgi:hypothetical protein